MVNYWAIQIGINQYRFLPPLSYAQRDAEQLFGILTQTGFAPHQCSLLADQITLIGGDPRFPTAQNIQAQIAQYQRVMRPEDVLLFFFSGYGMCHQGKEYLMPIEGDPRQIVATGIEVESLFQALSVTQSKVLVVLDANRSQLGLDRGGFGEKTIQLAHQYGIATLLSCQPTQFSHEPLTLRQGILTTALIAALQSGCATVEQLVQTVADRLPQLSEECWRPRQDALAFVPPNLRYQIILPEVRRRQVAQPSVGGLERLTNGAIAPFTPLKDSLVFPVALLSQSGAGLSRSLVAWFHSFTKPSADLSPLATPSGSLAASLPESMLPSNREDPVGISDEFFWRRLLMQGGLIAGILLFGVILRNSSALISSADRTINQLTPTTQMPQSPTASAGNADSLTPTPTISLDPELVMKSAEEAFQSQQFEEANRQLSQIPSGQRTPEQNQLLQQTNQALLENAKTMLIRTREPRAENQVSDLVEAIKIARLIKSDQPLYAESQQDIDRWSRVIMDMAEGRAARSNSESAMDIANQYKTAISAARLVPTDQPVHSQAEQAIAGWSQRILDLANDQAKATDFNLAIQIGELVPPYTSVYAAAQEAIAGWRRQPMSSQDETASVDAQSVESFNDLSVSEEPLNQQFGEQ